MPEGFPIADLIFVALVAGFIILRLRSTLGKNIGHDFTKRPQARAEQRKAEDETRQKQKPRDTSAIEEHRAVTDPAVAEGLRAVMQTDPSFDIDHFLKGARIAFEMVFDAFAREDKKLLKEMLGDEVYDSFLQEIEARQGSAEKTEITLVSAAPQTITEARLEGNTAHIRVQFLSEQVTMTRDAEGNILHGDASSVEKVIDEWSFERDLRSRDPNWKITAT